MRTWIALLRGINVGGRNKMQMADLPSTFEAVGCSSVRTYIQSGNVVFEYRPISKDDLSKLLGNAIADQFGFRPTILLLTDTEFRGAIENNPFVDAVSEPKTLHFYFLESVPVSPDIDALARLANATERFQLIDNVFYLHAPEGVGRSKLASGAERKLGAPATARNFSTIQALSAILAAAQPRQ